MQLYQDRRKSTRAMVTTGLFSMIAYLIMFLEFNLPFMPYFLKLDLSDVPALIVGFTYGPTLGIAVVLIKNLLQLLSTATFGIGELANFLIGSSFTGVASFCYFSRGYSHYFALAAGTVSMTFFAVLVNLGVVIPLYELVLDLPLYQIIALAGEVNPLVDGLFGYIVFVLVPFNLLKGTILSLMMNLVYHRIYPMIS